MTWPRTRHTLRDSYPDSRDGSQHSGTQESPRIMSPNHRTVAWITVRSVVLIVLGWLLIMVLFPAALVAAGT
jgi:hypothetical protein